MAERTDTTSLPIQVISLRRTPQRRSRFAQENSAQPHVFFDAVDALEIDRDSPEVQRLIPAGLLHYTRGAIGCALSHRALWDRAAEEDRPLTIAEDDAVLRHDFLVRSQETIGRLGDDWDVIMWGWNFDSFLSLREMPGVSPNIILSSQAQLRTRIAEFQRLDGAAHPLKLDKCLGTFCYSISPKGARLFRDQCFPLRNMQVFFPGLNRNMPNNGIDIAMNSVYATAKSYVAFPPLAVTRNETSESTVAGG